MGVGGSIRSFTLCLWVLMLMVAASHLVDAKAVCVPSSCGHIHNISHPFRLTTDPKHCGDYTLSCDENNITILHLQSSSANFYVQAINYNNHTIRAVDPGIQKNNCSSIPSYSVSRATFDVYDIAKTTFPVYFLKCPNPVLNASLYLDTAPCFNSTTSNTHGYVKVNNTDVTELQSGCIIERSSLIILSDDWDASYKYVHSALLYGFELQFYDEIPVSCDGQRRTNVDNCYPRNFQGTFRYLWRLIQGFFSIQTPEVVYIDIIIHHMDYRIVLLYCTGLLFLGRFIFGAPALMVFVIYKWRRRHLSVYNTIEEFLYGENNFVPIRYSYSDIKKMSNKFKDKLGEGGYGCVYKAKLQSGRSGAIKMLGKPKANGEEFICHAPNSHTNGITNFVIKPYQLGMRCLESHRTNVQESFSFNNNTPLSFQATM